jgi:hypothetical protein
MPNLSPVETPPGSGFRRSNRIESGVAAGMWVLMQQDDYLTDFDYSIEGVSSLCGYLPDFSTMPDALWSEALQWLTSFQKTVHHERGFGSCSSDFVAFAFSEFLPAFFNRIARTSFFVTYAQIYVVLARFRLVEGHTDCLILFPRIIDALDSLALAQQGYVPGAQALHAAAHAVDEQDSRPFLHVPGPVFH